MTTLTVSQNTKIITLISLAGKAAKAIQPYLQSPNMTSYLNFLDMMYHYTYLSEEKLLHAASKAKDSELKAFFKHQADEERGHYRMALADLAALGYDRHQQTPEVIEKYTRFWNAIPECDVLAYLGAVCVFENVASLVAEDVKNYVTALDLTKKQARWLLVHIEADEDHGREALELAQKFVDRDNNNAMILGAEKACDIWIEIFTKAFSDIRIIDKKVA